MNDTTTMDEGLSLDELQRNPFDSNASGVQHNPEDDKKLLVRFYMHPVQQTAKSIKAGRKIFKDTEYIEILIPGDKHSIIRRQVFDIDRQRFSDIYKRFKMGLENQNEGTPLMNLVWMTESKMKEYEFFNITTVEQLAQASDGSQAASVMGFPDDKRKAQSFLEAAQNEAPLVEMRAMLDERNSEIDMLKKQMEAMNRQISGAEDNASEKRGPGRPPKG